ncbi:MAG: glycoside hydrolase family 1 protein [Lachnospiraceae bacterium]|nr:glycoside hydrolase family 1 protein [Lachnospiraceae bacterium]
MKKGFPKGFLWGASTSAYQVEGAAYEDGKKASQQDVINHENYEKHGFANADIASDHYHHFKEDVALMKEMGFSAYRFSIAWSRVFPDGVGDVNEKGIQFYRDLIDELIRNDIEPIVTLYHYDLPWTLVEKYDGWIDRQVVAALGYAPVYPLSSSPQDMMAAQNAHDLRNAFYLDIYFKGFYTKSAMIYLEEHGLAPVIEPGDMELIEEGKSDFLALNYYYSDCAKACPLDAGKEISYGGVNLSGKKGEMSGFETHPGFYEMCKNPNLDTTDWDWSIDPTGLEYLFRDIYMRYNKPLMITENGMGAFDTLTEDGKIHDDYRIQYLREHIKAMKRAMDYGVEILAYCPWSALDLISTSNGVKKRYGFIYVDRTDDDPKECKRLKKDSFYWYQKVLKSNGDELD